MSREPYDEEPWEETGPLDDEGLTQHVDLWLLDARPERYDTSDKEWLSGVVDKVAREYLRRTDLQEVVHQAAQRLVHAREGQATQRGNRFLRKIAAEGTLPAEWGEGEDWRQVLAHGLRMPLSLGGQRVCIGAAGKPDLRQWLLEREQQREKRQATETATDKGALLLIGWVERQGVDRVDDLRK
ncbi:hypothetical protein [Streptomyces chartreusis]|uniref:hypothetical protein n=1 Tax=Streptomyces chartreusis TaxID=1969 RepID=UPI002E17524F